MAHSTLLRFIAAHIVPQTIKNHQSASFYPPITKQADQLLSAANQPVITIVVILMPKHPVLTLRISQPIWLQPLLTSNASVSGRMVTILH